MTVEEINKLPMIFIVGMGRSGTTLLRTILDASDEILFALEAKIIVALKQKYKHKSVWTPELLDELITDLYKDVVFTKWGIHPEDLRDKFLSFPMEKISFSFLLKVIYLSFPSPNSKGKILFLGDKNPVYSIFIKEILEVFPDARFIHLVRDYRDCILSHKKLFKRQNLFALSYLWKIYNSWIEIYSKKYPEKFYFIRYEDLIEEPENKIKEICHFIGLNYDSKMLNYYEIFNTVLSDQHRAEIEYSHPNILNKVNNGSIGKWKTQLTFKEQQQIAYILDEFGLKYGYERNQSYKSKKYLIGSLIGFWINIFDFFIIKGYYLLPFTIRDLLSKTSRFVFEKTGIITVYNQVDLVTELVEKKGKSG